jgi:hypothetical protein
LLILDCSWQHISIDFKEILADKAGINIVYIFVDWLSKRLISVLYNKEVDT